MANIKDEIQELETCRRELMNLKNKITMIQENMKRLETSIYTKCLHNWIIDTTNVGEHTEYICTICNMNK